VVASRRVAEVFGHGGWHRRIGRRGAPVGGRRHPEVEAQLLAWRLELVALVVHALLKESEHIGE